MSYETRGLVDCSPQMVEGLGRPTITQRLTGEKKELEHRLAHINKSLELLEKNPQFAELLDSLGRTLL